MAMPGATIAHRRKPLPSCVPDNQMTVKVEISFGELLDKLSILQIKRQRITDPAKVTNITRELEILEDVWSGAFDPDFDVSAEIRQLKAINEKIWDIEDDIREKEHRGEFDQAFIELARSVYINNDERAALKRQINLKLKSGLTEEKSYSGYKNRRRCKEQLKAEA
jgi:hypothetical protein